MRTDAKSPVPHVADSHDLILQRGARASLEEAFAGTAILATLHQIWKEVERALVCSEPVERTRSAFANKGRL